MQEPHAKPESKDKAGFLSSGTSNTLIYALQKKYISFLLLHGRFV